MIFNSNTTSLGATTIPMAEGYDAHSGVALALIESARNDYSMFKAMVQADYKELAICKESTGVVAEGEIAALQEAVGGGIFKKIAELFKKLVAKIKSIFANFVARLRGLFGKDKDLVKKYHNQLTRKNNLDKLEVKWRKCKSGKFEDAFDAVGELADGLKEPPTSGAYMVEKWDSDEWKRFTNVAEECGAKVTCDNITEFKEALLEDILEDEDSFREIKFSFIKTN